MGRGRGSVVGRGLYSTATEIFQNPGETVEARKLWVQQRHCVIYFNMAACIIISTIWDAEAGGPQT